MRLQHLRLVNPITYEYSLRLQEVLVERHFASKTIRRDASIKPKANAPPPTLITFQSQPTYTVGRRHLNTNPLSEAQIAYLTGIASAAQEESEGSGTQTSRSSILQQATFYPSPRGGLLTYHGPGQITAYLVLNLRTHGITPRCYIRMLENSVIKTCAKHGVPNAITTSDPGVWIGQQAKRNSINVMSEVQDGNSCTANDDAKQRGLSPTERKICAIGVHVSRGITSHGLGFNIYDAPIIPHEMGGPEYTIPKNSIYDPNQAKSSSEQHLNSSASQATGLANLSEDGTIPAPGYLSWGFDRIVACGLEGKSVTWLTREQKRNHDTKPGPTYLETVADTLASEIARSLEIDGDNIDQISVDDVIVPVDRDQKWKFLRSQSSELQDTRAKGDVLQQYRIRDLRGDSLLRIV